MYGKLTDALASIIDMENGRWEYDQVMYNVELNQDDDGEVIEDEEGFIFKHLDVTVRFRSRRGGETNGE